MSIVLLDKTKCILAGAEGGELILCTHARVREVYRRKIRGAYRSDTGHGIYTPPNRVKPVLLQIFQSIMGVA